MFYLPVSCFFSNQNELLSVPTHSILLPGQNVPGHMQTSMLSAWQIVSLDYSEWIDSVGYADLDGNDYNREALACSISIASRHGLGCTR